MVSLLSSGTVVVVNTEPDESVQFWYDGETKRVSISALRDGQTVVNGVVEDLDMLIGCLVSLKTIEDNKARRKPNV